MSDALVDSYAIRKLWLLDEPGFAAHLCRLDAESRHLRFGMAVNDAFLADYAATAHRLGTVVFGAFHGADIHGAAELRPLPHAGDAAEAAFTVEKPYRDHGLAQALMARVITAAQNRMIRELYMVCLRENLPMQHIAGKFGGRLMIEPGAITGTIAPAFPTPFSVFDEHLHDAQGMVTAVFNWAR